MLRNGATRARPVPPPAPASVGYNNLTFSENFDTGAGVDLSDTRAPGFNWYIHNAWPAAPSIGGWDTFPATNPATLSFSNSLMTAGQAAANTFGVCMATACADPANANNYIGKVFNNGFYAECRMAVTQPTSSPDFPAFWAWSVEYQTQNGPPSSWVEIDVMEQANTDANHTNLKEFNWVSPYTASASLGANQALNGIDISKQNIWGFLNLPASQNAGTGLFQSYINNVEITAADATYGTSGNFSQIDSQHMFIMLGWGVDTTSIQVDWVRVWQL